MTWNSAHDLELAAAASRGESRAQRQFILRAAPIVRGVVYGLLRDRTEADDVIQECLLAALRAVSRYSGEGPLNGWTRSVAVHRTMRFIRDRGRRRAHLSVVESLDPAELRSDVSNQIESSHDVDYYLDQLSAHQRHALLLRGLGHSIAEIAELTGASIDTVKFRIKTGRRRIRALVRRETFLVDVVGR